MIVAVVAAAFFIANWTILSSPVAVNLLLARVETPLAVLLLLCAGLVLLLDWVVHAFGEHSWRAERRQLLAELNSVRLRAEKEEESRTQALRVSVEREFAAVRAQLDRVLMGVQMLENDTMDVSALPPPAVEPELIPPRSAATPRR
jgi:hypothetical protein